MTAEKHKEQAWKIIGLKVDFHGLFVVGSLPLPLPLLISLVCNGHYACKLMLLILCLPLIHLTDTWLCSAACVCVYVLSSFLCPSFLAYHFFFYSFPFTLCCFNYNQVRLCAVLRSCFALSIIFLFSFFLSCHTITLINVRAKRVNL